MVKDPRKFNQSKIVQLTRMYNLEVSAVCTGEVFGEDGLSFKEGTQFVQKINRKNFSLMPGLFQGDYIDELKIFCKLKNVEFEVIK